MVKLPQIQKASTIRSFEMISKKLSLLVLALILSGMFVSGCGAATESTENWNMYENEKHGYSFMYPSDCFYGPMPSDCKQKPPEERRPECLCFLNGENPDQVSLEKMFIEADTVSGAPFHVSHYDTPVYNPPPGIDLITWIKDTYYSNSEDIPDEQNMELGGIPAVKFYTPKSPMAPSQEEIFFIKEDKLFRIYMIDVENENNRELYDQLLSSFSFEE